MVKTMPDSKGHFGIYGGRYVPETLFAALEDLSAAYMACALKVAERLAQCKKDFAGRFPKIVVESI